MCEFVFRAIDMPGCLQKVQGKAKLLNRRKRSQQKRKRLKSRVKTMTWRLRREAYAGREGHKSGWFWSQDVQYDSVLFALLASSFPSMPFIKKLTSISTNYRRSVLLRVLEARLECRNAAVISLLYV